MLISLRQEAQGKDGYRIMTPRAVQGRKQHLAILFTSSVHVIGVQMRGGQTLVSRFLSRLLKSASSGDVIRIMLSLITIILANSRSYPGSAWHTALNHWDRAHIILLQDLGDCPEDPLGVEVQAQLSNNQTSPRLEQPSIGAKQLEHVDHEAGKVCLLGGSRDLGQELQVMLDNLFLISSCRPEAGLEMSGILTSSDGSERVLSSAGKVLLSREMIYRVSGGGA